MCQGLSPIRTALTTQGYNPPTVSMVPTSQVSMSSSIVASNAVSNIGGGANAPKIAPVVSKKPKRKKEVGTVSYKLQGGGVGSLWEGAGVQGEGREEWGGFG